MFALRHKDRWVPVMRPTPPAALAAGNLSAMSAFMLAPFSNRLAQARFSFEGREYQLQPNAEGGYAIHGCVRKRPWITTHHTSTELRLMLQTKDFPDLDFPFPFQIEITYGLEVDALTARLALTNTGETRMPAGVGFHPYFQRTLLDAEDKVELQFMATGAYADLCPEGPPVALRPEQEFHQPRAVPREGFDTCFSGWDNAAKIHWPGSQVTAEMQSDPSLGHIILYTPPDEPFFALEPVSNANNGFNLLAQGIADAGVRVLERQETLIAGFRLRLC